MPVLRFLSFALALVALPAFAQNFDGKPAVFCEGLYALCIKAACAPIVDDHANITAFSCSCDNKEGWSMGPGSCDSRVPIGKNGNTFIMSTYSNFYNKDHLTMTCNVNTARPKPWAWCYGAPCMVDPVDPSKSTCTCPLGKENPMQTLGGRCGSTGGGCDGFWSAATEANDKFANQHFYDYMKQNHPNYPVNPPAQACPVGKG